MSNIITGAIACLLVTATAVPSLALSNRAVLLPSDQAKAMLEQCSRPTPEDVDGSWTVPAATVKRLERDLPQLADFVAKPAGGKAFDPSGFYRQYVGITVHGQKLIYINAFGGGRDRIPFDIPWRKTPVVVCDGGRSHWGAVYDPKTHEFSQLRFNGR
jgi:hypothetical protein